MLQRQVAIPPDREETVQSRDTARLRYQQSMTRDSEWSFGRPLRKAAGNRLVRARWGAHIKCECHVVLDVHLALDK